MMVPPLHASLNSDQYIRLNRSLKTKDKENTFITCAVSIYYTYCIHTNAKNDLKRYRIVQIIKFWKEFVSKLLSERNILILNADTRTYMLRSNVNVM